MARKCLACRTCYVTCPNKVDGAEFALHLRELNVERHGEPWVKELILRRLLPDARLLEMAGGFGRTAQQLGLDRLPILPEAARRAGAYAPRISPTPLSRRLRALAGPNGSAAHHLPATVHPLRDQRKPLVAYFYGCANDMLFPETGLDTVEVLRGSGYEVVVPEQACCGIPALGQGDMEAFRRAAEANLRSFLISDFDYVVADCASCSSTLKEYGRLLGTEAAGRFSAQVRDVTELLVSEGVSEELAPVQPLTVTYHDPCHLKRYQSISSQPRKLMARVPGVTLKEMKEPDRCCGAAGTFAITEPEIAAGVGRKKATDIIGTGAEMVVTACPGCRIQIGHSLEQAGRPLPILHPVELVAQAMRGAAQQG